MAVALLWKRHNGGNDVKNLVNYAFGVVGIVVCDVLADFIKVYISLWVKFVIPHAFSRSASMLSISCA